MENTDLSRLTLSRDIPRPRRRRWPLLLGVLILAAALFAWWFTAKRAIPVQSTRVTLAWPSQALTVINATGYVTAARKASVASKASGRLEWLGVTEGSRVRAGEVIARLENADLLAQVRQAEANVRVAKGQREQAAAEWRDAARALARARELFARRFLAESALDAALAREDKARAALASSEAALAAAQAALANVRVLLDYTAIRAPFDGVVLSKHANVGDVITPFTSALEAKGAVVTLADMSTLEVEADVSESNLQAVKVGQPCEIQLDAIPDARFTGRVSRIVPTVDRTKATVLVKVAFDRLDQRVLPDMAAKVAFLSRPLRAQEHQPRPALPAAAVMRRDGRAVVLRIDKGRAREVPVTLGESLGDLVVIDGGLSPGETVVLHPGTLRDGSRVRIAEKE
ncbi:efflux RND transporter periplasmic adaptor subunit [Thiobacter aerophilum]|uniref:Efflux RND transporter periplasmic adaptor subunit n=1 Tax=Thiobacter aerophilum TaxID=3121275 RepID=A0ABV0EDT9_9BURK